MQPWTTAQIANAGKTGTDDTIGLAFRTGAEYGIYTAEISHATGSDTDTAHGLISPNGRYSATIVKVDAGTPWYWAHPSYGTQNSVMTGGITTLQSAKVLVDGTTVSIKSAAPSGTYRVIVYADTPGIIHIGEYTGNGSADGPFVYTENDVRLLFNGMFTTHGGMRIYDSKYPGYNVVTHTLGPSAEGPFTHWSADLLSTGFKIRASHSDQNGSGSKYAHIAFGGPIHQAKAG
jgi:hypothetical protein